VVTDSVRYIVLELSRRPKEVIEYLHGRVFIIVRLGFTTHILTVSCFTPSRSMRLQRLLVSTKLCIIQSFFIYHKSL